MMHFGFESALFEQDANFNLLPFDGEVFYHGSIFSPDQSKVFFDQLQQEIHWQPDEIRINGKMIKTKRQVSWHGDNQQIYQYSGSIKQANPWTKTLLQLKEIIEKKLNTTFNSCLLNYYQTGEHAMAWHSDDEPELGKNPVIASLSFGANRKFCFKHKLKKHQCKIDLEDSGLLVMQGKTQQHWLHSLPVDTKCKTPRINLTFRTIY